MGGQGAVEWLAVELVVGLDHERCAELVAEGLDGAGGGMAVLGVAGQGFDGFAGGQAAHQEDAVEDAVDGLGQLEPVDGPDGARDISDQRRKATAPAAGGPAPARLSALHAPAAGEGQGGAQSNTAVFLSSEELQKDHGHQGPLAVGGRPGQKISQTP